MSGSKVAANVQPVQLPPRFGAAVEAALAEMRRQQMNAFAAEEIAAGRWPVMGRTR